MKKLATVGFGLLGLALFISAMVLYFTKHYDQAGYWMALAAINYTTFSMLLNLR